MKKYCFLLLIFFNYSFSQNPVFELLNSDKTGVEFNNFIEDKKVIDEAGVEHFILLKND